MRGWAEERCEARKKEAYDEIGNENEHESDIDFDNEKSM